MKIAYFDCFAGVSGDMILGALIDAGLRRTELKAALGGIPVKGYRIDIRRVTRAGLSGTKVTVRLTKGAGKRIRGLEDILSIVRRSALPATVTAAAEKVFRDLARAEAKVHGSKVPRVHFHELGAIDAIIDVIGSLAGLRILGIGEVYASALPWNSGTVRCAHGVLPVPAPAVAELMRGTPVFHHQVVGELVTPTGAALIKVCARSRGSIPPMEVSRVGYGAGGDQFDGFPNLLRLVVGEAPARRDGARVVVIETEVDDSSPALSGYLSEKLLADGALDVFMTPVMMKKGRMGRLITVLCVPEMAPRLAKRILSESTTLGVRFREERRMVLPRTQIKVTTPHGPVRVKLALRPGGRISAAPEYDDCARLSGRRGVPFIDVMAAAARAAEREIKKRGARAIVESLKG